MHVLTTARTDMERGMLVLASSLSLPLRTNPARSIASVEGFGDADGKGVMLLVPCEFLPAIDNAVGVSAEADCTNREQVGTVSRVPLLRRSALVGEEQGE